MCGRRHHIVSCARDQQQMLRGQDIGVRGRVESIDILEDLRILLRRVESLDRAGEIIDLRGGRIQFVRRILQHAHPSAEVEARNRNDTINLGILGAANERGKGAHAVADERNRLGINPMLGCEARYADRIDDSGNVFEQMDE